MRYQPTLVNGKPVEVETTVPVNYKLNAALQQPRNLRPARWEG
jgi:hypothetical protein